METFDTSCPAVPPHSALGKPDSLNSEFLYYSSILKVIAPAMSEEYQRQQIVPWIKKLFQPEYHSSKFREKRNRYLLYLTITLLNDESYGIFTTCPPEGALPEPQDLEHVPIPAAEWELDKMWTETLSGLPKDFQYLQCSIHKNSHECSKDHNLDTVLDQEFQLMLYIARPFAALVGSVEDRTKVATWLQLLCTIHGEICSSMRGIRNDYMMALLGYVSNLRLAGPFMEYPPWKSLPPLAESAKVAVNTKPITDPTGPEANEFLAGQPIPEEGAFCYIAITGELVASSFGKSLRREVFHHIRSSPVSVLEEELVKFPQNSPSPRELIQLISIP